MTESKVPGILAFDMMAKAEDSPEFPVVTFENHPHPDEVLTYSDFVVKGIKLARTMEKMGIYSEPIRPDDGENPVKVLLSAGTPKGIWETFQKRFNVSIHEWYGAMEGGFAHNPPGTGPIGSFGKPLDGVMEMKVVRQDDTECEPAEIGEIIGRKVAGETTVEYHGNPKASSAKTRGGWLRTGDMVIGMKKGGFISTSARVAVSGARETSSCPSM